MGSREKRCFRHQQNEIWRTGWRASRSSLLCNEDAESCCRWPLLLQTWRQPSWWFLSICWSHRKLFLLTLIHNLSSNCFEKTLLSVPDYLKDQFGNGSWFLYPFLRKQSPWMVLSLREVVLLQKLTWQDGWLAFPHLLAGMNDRGNRTKCFVQRCQTKKQISGARVLCCLCTRCCVPGSALLGSFFRFSPLMKRSSASSACP